MEIEVVPEPTAEERRALLAALADAEDAADGHPAYASPWWRAGLPERDDETGDPR